jgi:hypothetical protein
MSKMKSDYCDDQNYRQIGLDISSLVFLSQEYKR